MSTPGPQPPLILTLVLETTWQEWFTALRRAHFPRHRNYLDAHLTLFHHLPPGNAAIDSALVATADREPLLLEAVGVHNMGNGVAFAMASSVLDTLHRSLQQHFDPWLIPQDRQRLWPHITIQNKVTAFKAQTLHRQLSGGFTPFTVPATGLQTWYYRGGPWEPAALYPFRK